MRSLMHKFGCRGQLELLHYISSLLSPFSIDHWDLSATVTGLSHRRDLFQSHNLSLRHDANASCACRNLRPTVCRTERTVL